MTDRLNQKFVSLNDDARTILLDMLQSIGGGASIAESYVRRRSRKCDSITEPMFIACDEACSQIENDKLANLIYDSNGVMERVVEFALDELLKAKKESQK